VILALRLPLDPGISRKELVAGAFKGDMDQLFHCASLRAVEFPVQNLHRGFSPALASSFSYSISRVGRAPF
jgi:hypothetical protein